MKTLKILEIALFVIILIFGSSVFALNGKTEEVDNIFSLEDGLVGYWSFDEGSGNTAHDISGNDNHGTIHGASWTTGISGSALEFDGQSDYLQIPDSDSLDLKTNAFTITAWINADSFFGEGGHNGNLILCKWQTQTIGQYHLTAYSGGSLKLLIADGTTADYVRAFDVLSTNEWNFVVASWDGAIARLYANGELVAENSTTILSLYQEDYYSDYVQIGHDTGGSYPYWFFDGTIDEVRIYERALDGYEILNIYNEINSGNLSYNWSFPSSNENFEIEMYKPYTISLDVVNNGPNYYNFTYGLIIHYLSIIIFLVWKLAPTGKQMKNLFVTLMEIIIILILALMIVLTHTKPKNMSFELSAIGIGCQRNT